MNFRNTALLICSIAAISIGCGSSSNNSRNATATPIPGTATPPPTVTAQNTATATATIEVTQPPTSTPASSPPPTSTPPPTATPTSTVQTQCFDTTLDASSCDPATATFTLDSTNPYYPLHVGLRVVLEGEEDGETIRVERVVLEDTEIVAGVETHVLEHKEFIDDEIHEIARNFYVESTDGTVCYFGEDVEFYEDGVLVDMHGSWRAGVDGSKPGIIMPANPKVGDAYFQENAPGIANDMGRVSGVEQSRTLNGVAYDDVVVIQDSNPMETCDEEEEKLYAPGIGEIQDDILQLIDVTPAEVIEWGVSLFRIELTEDDIEIQTFVDGPRWRNLHLSGPNGQEVLTISAGGNMRQQGLSEMQIDGWPSHFPIVGNPDHLEIESVDEFLQLFPAGTYRFEADTVDGRRLVGEADFTHDLPGLPEIVTPDGEDEAEVLDIDEAVIRWEPVTENFAGTDEIDIVEYEIVVEQVEPFRKLSIHLPGSATNFTVPPEFLSVDSFYDVEVVAIEESDNQTISGSEFRTSDTTEAPEEGPGPGANEWKVNKFFIELTEDDIEVQSFVDGSRWLDLEIYSPNGQLVFSIDSSGNISQQGLSELTLDGWPSHFPIVGDPDHLEIESVDVYLQRFPAGTYSFTGTTVDGQILSGEASFTHDLPALPEIISPEDSDEPEVFDLNDVVLEWEPVTETYSGSGEIDIIEYEVIVEQVEPFRKLFAHVAASTTTFTVPPNFLEPGQLYDVEIVAIEKSNNQTISVSEFQTSSDVRRCFDTTLAAAACDPDVATFTLNSTNTYYPLTVGLQVILEGEEDGEIGRVERTVLADTEIVGGVETHVLEHKQFIDGEIYEIARNFYVESTTGTVCYFGEDVEFYEDGELIDTHGTWRVGIDGAKPGIIMPANPMVGDAYFQENAPGIATDMGRVSDVNQTRTIGGVTYDNLLVIQDSNPMEDCSLEEEKVYAPGIGEIQDDVLQIIDDDPLPQD